MNTEKNVPLTSKEVEELPKGYHASLLPNRQFFKRVKRGLIVLTPLGIVYKFPPNCRKLTKGRKDYKTLKFGRVTNFKKGA